MGGPLRSSCRSWRSCKHFYCYDEEEQIERDVFKFFIRAAGHNPKRALDEPDYQEKIIKDLKELYLKSYQEKVEKVLAKFVSEGNAHYYLTGELKKDK